jgi:LPS export ABC transporter protein LptC
VLLGTVAACHKESPQPGPGPEERIPQQTLENFSLRNTSTEGLLWILEADRGVSYGPSEPIRLTNMRVRFYDGRDEVRSVLTSRQGEVQEATQALFASDSVVVATPAGDTLRTESLRWDPRTQKIDTDVAFSLVRGRDILTGIGLEADPDLRHYRVEREVRAALRDGGGSRMGEELDGGAADGR